MKFISIIAIFILTFALPGQSNEAPHSLEWVLPEKLAKLLLEKTGTASIRTITKAVYLHTESSNILAISAELNNNANLTGNIIEEIMQVNVAFVVAKSGKLTLYSLAFPIKNILNEDKINLNEDYVELK